MVILWRSVDRAIAHLPQIFPSIFFSIYFVFFQTLFLIQFYPVSLPSHPIHLRLFSSLFSLSFIGKRDRRVFSFVVTTKISRRSGAQETTTISTDIFANLFHPVEHIHHHRGLRGKGFVASDWKTRRNFYECFLFEKKRGIKRDIIPSNFVVVWESHHSVKCIVNTVVWHDTHYPKPTHDRIPSSWWKREKFLYQQVHIDFTFFLHEQVRNTCRRS